MTEEPRTFGTLFHGMEGTLFLTGWAMWNLLLLEVILVWVADPHVGRAIVLGGAAEIFTGREGGIPVGLAEGAPPWLVMQVSFTQDIASALLVYPLFLHALHRYHDRDVWIMRRIRALEGAAERHQGYVHKWGPLGVFFFMLVPFLVNGPFIGLVVGRLTGIPTRIVLTPVLLATATAAIAWTYAFDAVFALTNSFDPGLGRAIAFSVFGLLAVLTLVDYIIERKNEGERGKKAR